MSFGLYAFDAYGTLFDVHSAVARHAAEAGARAARLSELWRTKQLEYSWVRALCGAYRDFRALTADALDYAGEATGGLSPDLRGRLLAAYDELAPYADARPALTALKAQGARLAILSNGSPDMLASAVGAAGFGDLFEAVISVDELRTFKTAPAVYAHAAQRFGVGAGQVAFFSSNRWDVAGAAAFGFKPCWVNRADQPDEYRDLAPVRVIRGLDELAAMPF